MQVLIAKRCFPLIEAIRASYLLSQRSCCSQGDFTMKHALLGNTGLIVSRLAFGATNGAGAWVNPL
jgi:hypothetical protein